MLEGVGALVAAVLALVVSYVAGNRAPVGQPLISLLGLAIGEVCAGVYLGVANWVGRSTPGLLDAHLVGICFMALLFAAGLCGIVGARFGHRKSMGLGLF